MPILSPTMAADVPSELVVVSCYTRFDNLAHGPRGRQAALSLYTYRLDTLSGQLVLVSVTKEPVMNPAFTRLHPEKNLLYTCTESVAEPGEIVTWAVSPRTGQLSKLSSQSAGGTSTCYLTLDRECKNMLVVNYWDATIGVFGVDAEHGHLSEARSFFDPNEGRPMRARHDRHVNHSENDAGAQAERQADPHSHAVILDPYVGRVAFVPDLGMDVIRQFRYDPAAGRLEAMGSIKSGAEGRRALGPRYIEFHPTLPICYVVNELSSEVAVFEFNRRMAEAAVEAEEVSEAPMLRLLQTIRTIPDAYPGDLNTCGRIAVHRSGQFVLVSNRGHNSIAVLRVHMGLPIPGLLSVVGVYHTRGATPRHFQFDTLGQWLIAANQDSDRLVVFRFNLATGRLELTGNEYSVPSPNFVCCMRPREVSAPAATPEAKDIAPLGAPLAQGPFVGPSAAVPRAGAPHARL